MLTIRSYIRYVENPARAKYLAMLLFFMLGLMTKPMLVTLPFVLLLLDYWPLKRTQFVPDSISGQLRLKAAARSDYKNHPHPLDAEPASFLALQSRSVLYLIREKIPLLVLSGISCGFTYLVQQGSGAVQSMEAIPLTFRVANALVSYVAYMGKMILPFKLAVFYPYPAAIGLVQIGAQAMADRYAYLTLIGLFIAVVWSVPGSTKIRTHGKKMIPAAAVLVVGLLGLMTWIQVGYWRNSVELYRHAIEVTNDNYLAHHNLGNALLSQGKTDEAYNAYAEALRIYPDYADAHYNIGRLLDTRGKLDAAIIHYKAATRVNPRLKKAYYNMGNVLAHKGSYAEAIRNYSQALRIDPDYAEAHNNIGVVLIRQGKINEAATHFQKAVNLKANYAAAQKNLRKVRNDMKHID